MNQLVLSLLSIFGGVLITAAAGLIGAAIGRRGEHRKWLRERRYEAVVDFLKVIDDMPQLASDGETVLMRPTFGKELSDAGGPLTLLGPDHLVTKARLLIREATEDGLRPRRRYVGTDVGSIIAERGDFLRARIEFIEAARGVMKVTDPLR